ncbi:hypothetical protein FACS1894219_05730 [Clostridia bacterium]|nr:hypothetical protein FACS1894219_05730 [Clostridia bacterium]
MQPRFRPIKELVIAVYNMTVPFGCVCQGHRAIVHIKFTNAVVTLNFGVEVPRRLCYNIRHMLVQSPTNQDLWE